ncbi:MAG: hypothetical protein WC612_02570 [Bdellovibrionales bacterium]
MTASSPFLYSVYPQQVDAREIKNAIMCFKEGLDILSHHPESGIRYFHGLTGNNKVHSVFNTNVPSGPISYSNGKLAPIYFSLTIGHSLSPRKGTVFTHATHLFHLFHCNHDPLCTPVTPIDDTLESYIHAALKTIEREAKRFGLLPSKPFNPYYNAYKSKPVSYTQCANV